MEEKKTKRIYRLTIAKWDNGWSYKQIYDEGELADDSNLTAEEGLRNAMDELSSDNSLYYTTEILVWDEEEEDYVVVDTASAWGEGEDEDEDEDC